MAGAMMGTSALLGWMDSSHPPPVRALSSEETLWLARSLVADDLAIRQQQWGSIEILAAPATSSASFLTARADRAEHHFCVDLDGLPSRTMRWSRQVACAAPPCAVKIEVARGDGGQSMSRAQWNSVRALIAALHDAVAAEGDLFPVRLQDEWAEVYNLEPGTASRWFP